VHRKHSVVKAWQGGPDGYFYFFVIIAQAEPDGVVVSGDAQPPVFISALLHSIDPAMGFGVGTVGLDVSGNGVDFSIQLVNSPAQMVIDDVDLEIKMGDILFKFIADAINFLIQGVVAFDNNIEFAVDIFKDDLQMVFVHGSLPL